MNTQTFTSVFITYLNESEAAATPEAAAQAMGLPPTADYSIQKTNGDYCLRASISLTSAPYHSGLLDAAGNRWAYRFVPQPNFWPAGRTRLEFVGAPLKALTPEEEFLTSNLAWGDTTPGQMWYDEYYKTHFPGLHPVQPAAVEAAYQAGLEGKVHLSFRTTLEGAAYRSGLEEYVDAQGAGGDFVAYATNPNYEPRWVDSHFYRLYRWRFGSPPEIEVSMEDILSSDLEPTCRWQEILLSEAKRLASESRKTFLFESANRSYEEAAAKAYQYAIAL